jgi:hypothetical protein
MPPFKERRATMVHVQRQPDATLPAQEIIHPGEGIIEGYADVLMKRDEAKSERKQLNGFVPGTCSQPPVMHQAQQTFMLVVFGKSVCQIAQRPPSLPFMGDGVGDGVDVYG